MANISLKLRGSDLARIKGKLAAIEKLLTSTEGPVFHYVLTINNGYAEAVLSGMGKTSSGVINLKKFLGDSVNVTWEPLSPVTLKHKAKNNWKMEIWMASGETARAVKVATESGSAGFVVMAGIDSGTEAYTKAMQAEFGGLSTPGGKEYEGRALFTLLNAVFRSKSSVVRAGILKAVRSAILQSGWGS